MDSARSGNTLVIRLDPGEEVLSSITGAVSREGSSSGIITSFVGALKDCRLILKKGLERSFSEHLEVVGNGNICDLEGRPLVHLHVVAGNDEGVHVGHLLEAHVDIFCELSVSLTDGLQMRRLHSGELERSGVTVPYVLDFGQGLPR